MKFEDQIFLITGGAGNMGAYFCDYCISNKATKVILVDNDKEALARVKEKFHDVDVYSCDLADHRAVSTIINDISENTKITVLINNAGWIHSEPLINLLNPDDGTHNFEHWDRAIRHNLYSCFNVSSFVALKMVRSRTRGLIINISSIAAQGNAGQSAYSAAKAGVEALTKVWSKELGFFKIRCAAIAPGFINTSSTLSSVSDKFLDSLKKQIPLGALGELEHISAAMKFIVEDDYFTGKILAVDGGLAL